MSFIGGFTGWKKSGGPPLLNLPLRAHPYCSFSEQASQSREALPAPKEEENESSAVEGEEVKNESIVTAELKILEKMLGSIQSPPS